MSYELRLLGVKGETTLIYKTLCASDEAAKALVHTINRDYTRYEIWRDMEKIAEGTRITLH